MVVRVVALLVVVGLAGCLDATPAADGPWAPRAFEATYLFGSDGGTAYDVTLRLDAPVRIMDSEEQHRWAYPLHVDIRDDGPHMSMTFMLDGELRLVRIDARCGLGFHQPELDCFQQRTVYYQQEGALPPFGYAWPHIAEAGELAYTVHGADVRAPLITDADGQGVPDDSPVPFWMFLEAENRYTYDGPDPVPSHMLIQSVFNGYRAPLTAELRDYRQGDVLDAIAAWPRDAPRALDEPAFGMVGMDDEIFHLGIDWNDAFRALAEDPVAAAAMDGGCLDSLWAIGGSFDGLITAVLNGAFVSLHARIIDAEGDASSWAWGYTQRGLQIVPATEDLLSGYHRHQEYGSGGAAFCTPPAEEGVATPTTTMQAAWQLPLHEAGWPCSFRYEAYAMRNTYSPLHRGDGVMVALLTQDVTDNQPNSSQSYRHAAAMSDRTGRWAWLSLPASDMDHLDAGGWEHRPLPIEDPGFDPEKTRFRCVEPAQPKP